MRVAGTKILIVTLMIAAYVGQAAATTMMAAQDHSAQLQTSMQIADADVVDHSQHANMESEQTLCTSDCCPDGHCDLGNCFTAALPASDQAACLLQTSTAYHYAFHTEVPPTVSLYRPPISR